MIRICLIILLLLSNKALACVELSKRCVEGAETRIIDGQKVHKECWKYEVEKECLGERFINRCGDLEDDEHCKKVGSTCTKWQGEECKEYTEQYQCKERIEQSTCGEYEKKCELIGEECVSSGEDGTCLHKEKKYSCFDLSKVRPLALDCKVAKYCIGDKCESSRYEADKDFAKAVSALSVLTNIRKDFIDEECKKGAQNCKVFRGSGHKCRINGVGARNCCKDNGWAKDAKLMACNESEKMLGKKKEARLCKDIGSYCSKRILGACLERSRSYCCFGSKLARIIQIEGRRQLGISWGTVKTPNCQPLTIEQLQKVNFNNMDLREIYEIATANLNISNHNKITEKAAGEVSRKLGTSSTYSDEISRRMREHYDN
ncbi:MAG: conjugal transfer protein TraN [Alphaproteobacteria bacterium]|jgi:conjugal transfer mating pair stabilization protein TraN